MKKEIRYTFDRINDVAYDISLLLQEFPCCVIAFYGDLGAGKTTFIRALGKVWGVTDAIISPTFAYLNIYQIGNEQCRRDPVLYDMLYHYDLYRLTCKDEFFTIGLNDYIGQPGAIAVIEWPDIIADFLPKNTASFYLSQGSDINERLLTVVLPAGDTKGGK